MLGRTGTFLQGKYLPTGEFEKLKARLVAGGNQQDKDLHEDLSATASSLLQLWWSKNGDEECSNQFNVIYDEKCKQM